MKALTDDQILDYIQGGEKLEQGFKMLMHKYQERLYWHIRRMVEHHDDANDIIQNTFLKVYKSIHRFKRKSQLYTWLYRIATNEAISYLKKNKKHQWISMDQEETSLENQLHAEPEIDGNEIFQKLKTATKNLPHKQQTVFNLRYYDEMSYHEMSELLDTSVGALKASYHHAVKKIEHYLVTNES